MKNTHDRNTDWAQKYRPKSIDDMVLPIEIKNKLKNIFDNNNGMSLLLYGRPGCGKTTAAKLLGPEIMFVSCSENGVEMIRNLAKDCSSHTLSGDRRIVVLDEADALTKQAQDALRGIVEAMSVTSDFIMTANDPNSLSEALRSRFLPLLFEFPLTEQLRESYELLLTNIAKNEGFENIVKSHIQLIIKEQFPDVRRMIKRLQFDLN